MDERKKLRIKRILALITFVILSVIVAYLTYFFAVRLKELSSVEDFKEYIGSFGAYGVLVALGLQILQVFIPLIPGEVVEVGLGFSFGAFWGTVICYAGLFLASLIVFLLVKKLGIRFVELFVPMEKINSVKFIHKNISDPERLKKITFILFFIPGTPKDLFTYVLGFTPIKYYEFIVISMIARIPSVVTSTIGGNLIANEKYVFAVVLFVVTGVVSICGWLWYDRYSKKKNRSRNEEV